MSVFWRWWAAGTSSDLGSAVGGVALPLTALAVLDATPFEMGLIAAAGYVAWLAIGLPAGVIVQRLPLRGTQVGADLVRALAVTSIPVAWWLGVLSVTQLVVVALTLSFAHVIFFVANTTFLPEIVSRDQLQSRNSLTSGTHATTQLAGPSLGGLAVQVLGAVPTLLIDAASYLVSAALLRTLPPRRGHRPDQPAAMGAMIREGWAYVTRHPMMGPAMWSATALKFVCGAHLTLFPLYLVRELHAPPGVVGLLLAVDGLGTLIGAALTTRATNALGTARGLIILGFVEAAAAFVIPLGTGWVAYLGFTAGVLIFAGTVCVFSVTTRTYRQIASPPELLSRVMATVRFVSWGAIPVGGLVAGALAGPLGARTTLLIVAVAALAAPLALLFSPVRGRRDLLEPTTPEREAAVG
ncbi:MFS transporter [Actinoplanes auranticolor]|uniref:MFS transporter n=1 Tax=Actinoplanes auranticolor TaxID=47988 RepID=A0A919VPC3_9ACTN|nr:MFS transporter [Actinoplanes auranticolor]GIM73674.1 MFS transporter [Actinoplanes auranticolor]